MGRRVQSLVLPLLIFILLRRFAIAESENEAIRNIQTAPHRNLGSAVIDGTGKEGGFQGFDERKVSVSTVAWFTLAISAAAGLGAVPFFFVEGGFQGFDERKASGSRVSVSTVAWFTLAMAAATGLGAVPFFFVELEPQWAGVCNGLASGVMLAASFDLVQEGQTYGSENWVVMGILPGGNFIWLCKKPIVAVPSFLCADAFHKFLPFCTGFAAGCMIWMVAEVLPNAFKDASPSEVASAGILAVAFMETLSTVFQTFSNGHNSEDASGFLVSLLFGLSPLLGGFILVVFALAFCLPHFVLRWCVARRPLSTSFQLLQVFP